MTNYQKRFLDPKQLESAAAEVGALAKQEGVRVALIGGFALQHYGSDRLTGDIDFAADSVLEGLPSGPPLSFGGVQTTSPKRSSPSTGLPDWAIAPEVRGMLFPATCSIAPTNPEQSQPALVLPP